jgi:hypothetical protein
MKIPTALLSLKPVILVNEEHVGEEILKKEYHEDIDHFQPRTL